MRKDFLYFFFHSQFDSSHTSKKKILTFWFVKCSGLRSSLKGEVIPQFLWRLLTKSKHNWKILSNGIGLFIKPEFYNFENTKWKKIQKNVEMPGIEPGAFHMQSERATTALHPRLARQWINKIFSLLWIIWT